MVNGLGHDTAPRLATAIYIPFTANMAEILCKSYYRNTALLSRLMTSFSEEFCYRELSLLMPQEALKADKLASAPSYGGHHDELPLRDAFMPSLVQIMACPLFGAKPLSVPMIPYCPIDPREHISMNIQLKLKHIRIWNVGGNSPSSNRIGKS